MSNQSIRLGQQLLHTALFVACLGVAWYAFSYFSRAADLRDPFHVKFIAAGWAVPGHFIGGALALLLAPVQLSAALRRRWPGLHRVAGWLSVAAIGCAALCGFALALNAQGGAPAALGFMSLSVLWLLCTAVAVRHIVAGRVAAHRRWMIRVLALTTSAVTLRVFLVLGAAWMHWPFLPVYVATSWLCWLVNLTVAEVYLRWPRQGLWRSGGARAGSGQ